MTAAYFILYVGMQWVFGSLNWSFNTHTLKRRAEIKPILMLHIMLYVLFFNTTYTYYSSIATARKVGARLKLEASRDKKIPFKKTKQKNNNNAKSVFVPAL